MLNFQNQVFSIEFHPKRDLIATAQITGHITISSKQETWKNIFTLKPHKSSCRSLSFSPNKDILFTGSSDKSLSAISLSTEKVLLTCKNAMEHPINIIKATSNFIISGDDSGSIKLFDMNSQKEVMNYKEHSDYISDFEFIEDKKVLLATSGDGLLSIYDIRKSDKPLAVSENQDEELLSVNVLKHGKKVIVGATSGTMSIFSWGHFLDSTDRFPGVGAIESVAKVDEDFLLTGSEDGKIRLVSIQPNHVLSIVGMNPDSMPIEKVIYNSRIVASCSHESIVRFWEFDRDCETSTSTRVEAVQDQKEESSDEEDQKRKKKKAKKHVVKTLERDFFSGID